jgi:general secretion pathway protein D
MPAEAAASTEPAALIQLNFPPEVELKVLVEYVSQRLGKNILFDEQVGNKKITIRAPEKVAPESLMGVLESALRMKGLVLMPAEQPGWLRIVQPKNFAEVSRPADAASQGEAGMGVLTQVFVLKHVDPKRVEAVVRPFLTERDANTVVISEQRVLIVTDFAQRLEQITSLVELMDQSPGAVDLEFLPVKQLWASDLATKVGQLMKDKAKMLGGAGGEGSDLAVVISADARTNQLILLGRPALLAEAKSLIAALDVPLGLQTKAFAMRSVSPERLDKLARKLVSPLEIDRLYFSGIDPDANLLMVTATPEMLEQIETIRASLDVPAAEGQSPMQFYKLKNVSATDVLATIRALEEGGTQEVNSDQDTTDGLEPTENQAPQDQARQSHTTGMTEPYQDRFSGLRSRRSNTGSGKGSREGGGVGSVKSDRATVVADDNTNSIIVIAPPEVRQEYEKLIKMLDHYRPQVLIEATIATLDTSNGFSLGVEISRAGSFSVGDRDGRTLSFSSFGLSEVDKDTGQLKLIPGVGFNGTVISADIADVVIRALRSNGRAKVMSAPRVLVNNNATGSISSVREQPFTSVNASDTVSTTSFGGFVSAGTEIEVTPHISEGDHVRLEFAIALNSFTSEGSNGIPPPRQTNSVQSEVTVPDGHTIIVGGINQNNVSETIRAVPILGEIPLLKHLFRSEQNNSADSTLFVFIRPVILRDDRFGDLKHLSWRDVKAAGLPSDAPPSSPMLVR